MLIDGPFPKTLRPAVTPVRKASRKYRRSDAADAVPRQSLEPERLQEILGRLASGMYDRPEVRDRIVARIGAALGYGAPW